MKPQFTLANSQDLQKVLTFLYQEPFFNLFFTGNILSYGLQSKITQTFILKEKDEVISAYQIYHSKFLLFFDPKNTIKQTDLEKIFFENNLQGINIAENEFQKFKDFFMNSEKYVVYKRMMALLEEKNFAPVKNEEAVKAKLEDIPNIVAGRMTIEEFYNSRSAKEVELETYLRNYKLNVSHNFIIKDKNNKVLSHACIGANNDYASMIVGVYTLKETRHQGYALKVMSSLCEYIFHKLHKKPVLFYDNPEAGKIYLKLGFKVFSNFYSILKKS